MHMLHADRCIVFICLSKRRSKARKGNGYIYLWGGCSSWELADGGARYPGYIAAKYWMGTFRIGDYICKNDWTIDLTISID